MKIRAYQNSDQDDVISLWKVCGLVAPQNNPANKINLQVRTTNKSVIAFYKAMGYGVDDVVGLGKRLEHDS